MDETQAQDYLRRFRDPLAKITEDLRRKEVRTQEDYIALGAMLAFCAQCVFEAIGGRDYAAAQFYAMADDLAIEKE